MPQRQMLHPPKVHISFAPLVQCVRKNVVMFVALLAALVTACIVPPDSAYADYFDLKTLTCLFCVLAVVCALKNIQFFSFWQRRSCSCSEMPALPFWHWCISPLSAPC